MEIEVTFDLLLLYFYITTKQFCLQKKKILTYENIYHKTYIADYF